MAVMIASDLAKDMAGTPLLRGVSFKLERKDRLTIAGRNGAGKTTLLRMLARETSIDGGDLVLEKGCKIVLHDQRPPRDQDITLRDYVLSACTEPLELEAQLTDLEAKMGEGDETVFSRYADVQARFEAAGGYGWREATNGVIHGLGFVDADLDRELSTFSGGQITRASLARALAATPDLLLLDEPTNHLDIETLEWLEQKLVSLDAAIIMVAHDRWFLEAVGTCVLEVEAGRTRFFKGTWHTWRREQAARELALGKAIEKQQAEIARMEAFVERFRAKASKAKQAQSRVKALDKVERITRDPRDTREMGFKFKKAERTGRVIFEIDGAHLEVGEPPKTLIHDADLWLESGEHVSLVGPNGTGKSTLVSALTGQRLFDAGTLRTGHNVKVGYLSQHGDELEKDGARTVAEAAVKRTGLSPNEARSLLGKFLFSGEQQDKPLEGLSGGERQRLSLAILVASGSNVLILDEPTNHLDLESREALEDALTAFDGALILVSHDRALLEAVGTRTIAVERYGLRSYVGGWQEYFSERQLRLSLGEDDSAVPRPAPMGALSARFATNERTPDGMAVKRSDTPARPRPTARKPEKVAATNGSAANGTTDAKAERALSKNRQKLQAKLETAIEDAEAALVAVEEELAAPEAWATPYETAKSTAKHTAAKRAVEAAYAAREEFEAQATA